MNHIDELIRSVRADTPAGDRVERDAIDAARRSLRTAVAAERSARGTHNRRRRLTLLFAVLAVAGLALPAFREANKWFAAGSEIEGITGDEPPQLTSTPVVVASGEPEENWTIYIARSDQGVCLNLDVGDAQFDRGRYRLGDCGFSSIRGDLPPDVRGDPSAPCIGLTAMVPCGSRPEYAVTYTAAGFVGPDFRRAIFAGSAAADVAGVELVLADGDRVETHVVQRPLGPDVPLNVYWVELGPEDGLVSCPWRDEQGHLVGADDGGGFVREVVARDRDGNVLGRRVAAWNENPTGDPDGPPPTVSLERDACER